MRQLASLWTTAFLIAAGSICPSAQARVQAAVRARPAQLDAPLLFVKRHNYLGLHIYDTYYKWRPGGGIYILENPADSPDQHRIRPLVDPTTPGSPGPGVYSDPDLSWDGARVLFCHKGEQHGSTSVYEVRIDGSGLRRLSDPTPYCGIYAGSKGGQHDVSPAYLPDGRLVLTSTRPSGLVPCANSGVDILHVMDSDGGNLRPISVNNVNEFDPAVLPDGRILFGRWEYVDKTALTVQSLWTVFPDGTQETALYANNMVFPEALLDARPVPGTPGLLVATLAPHNAPPRGAIAFVDTRRGKNAPIALTNLDRPDVPAHDRGESCDPWPLSEDTVLCSGRVGKASKNAILLVDRSGRRDVVVADPDIDCHAPIPLTRRQAPPPLADTTNDTRTDGRFYIQNVYAGLDGIPRGTVTHLRVIEETSRVSATPGGALNQTFLVSAALAFSCKNVLGIVPVYPDGSAYFTAPSHRSIYLQALDKDGRLVQSMRTFVQAAPGTIRSCIGCHEQKYAAPANAGGPLRLTRAPDAIRPESWGSGFLDYSSMVQPILDRHCVQCHGGKGGIAARLDLSGGWTEYFSISYENLVTRKDTQVTAHLIAGIDCMNGTSYWSSRIFPPRSHGSGAAPLAKRLVKGHGGRIPELTRPERDLLLAWIDSNGVYYGSWDYTSHGSRTVGWPALTSRIAGAMAEYGCVTCHNTEAGTGFENDWVNLRRPEMSRILRAPLAKGGNGHGLALCRKAPMSPGRKRLRILANGRYEHAVRPLESFRVKAPDAPAPSAPATPVFASTEAPGYQTLLRIIREARRDALARPRVDMPTAGPETIPGRIRVFCPPPLPTPLPPLTAEVDRDAMVRLCWERSARTIGLTAEVHRGAAGFVPGAETLVADTPGHVIYDVDAPAGAHEYALILRREEARSAPIRCTVRVPEPAPPPPPEELTAHPTPGAITLRWLDPGPEPRRYHVEYRADADDQWRRATVAPITRAQMDFAPPAADRPVSLRVRTVSRRAVVGPPCPPVEAQALPEIREPVARLRLEPAPGLTCLGDAAVAGKLHAPAKAGTGGLTFPAGGHLSVPPRSEFRVQPKFSISLWLRLASPGQMPVVASAGRWRHSGWFLQRLGNHWRWHVAGIDCDGGTPAIERWVHLAATYSNGVLCLYEDGKPVAKRSGTGLSTPWTGPLMLGQYSGGAAPPYQVDGSIRGFRIYQRELPPQEVARLAEARP